MTAVQRAQALRRLIEVAKECRDLNNFFSLFALLSGLNLSPVARLKKTWAVRCVFPPEPVSALNLGGRLAVHAQRAFKLQSYHGTIDCLQALPSATRALYDELLAVMDTSKNMLAYRAAVAAAQPPLIPFFRAFSLQPKRALCVLMGP